MQAAAEGLHLEGGPSLGVSSGTLNVFLWGTSPSLPVKIEPNRSCCSLLIDTSRYQRVLWALALNAVWFLISGILWQPSREQLAIEFSRNDSFHSRFLSTGREDFFPTTANRSLNSAFYPILETVILGMCREHSRTLSRPLGNPNFIGLRRAFSGLLLFLYTLKFLFMRNYTFGKQ